MYAISKKRQPKPKPMRQGSHARRKYPFDDMEPGDNFFIPHRERNTIGPYLAEVNQSTGKKFSSRLCYMRETARNGWVLCDEGDEGAVLGLGVWRDE